MIPRGKKAGREESVKSKAMISEKWVKFGYARVRHTRLYCEKFHLLSNAFPHCEGFTIEGIAGTAGKPYLRDC